MVEREFAPKWRGQVSLRVLYIREGIVARNRDKSVERKAIPIHEIVSAVTASNRRAFASYLVKPRPTFPRIDRVTVINREKTIEVGHDLENSKAFSTFR